MILFTLGVITGLVARYLYDNPIKCAEYRASIKNSVKDFCKKRNAKPVEPTKPENEVK